ncbi:MAG: PHP domain-containing protein [Clostridia bacterium]|nr:PHP domain-containing protein [Clostridia bacterium]
MNHDIKADLHIHTTASDGTWTPEELVPKIQEHGIGLFAITDHDTTAHIARGEKLAMELELSFIRGVEISTMFNNKTFHILGLGINPSHSGLSELVASNQRLIDEKDDMGIRYLARKYPQVSFEEYEAYENDRRRGGWKSLNYLVDKGLCTSHKDFFKLFSEWGASFGEVQFASPELAVKTIREAGGTPILAHPGSNMYGTNYKQNIAKMLDFGIGGIECYHPENGDEVTAYCLKLCKENKLCISGGSDCHGPFVSTRRLGYPEVRLSMLNLEGIEII